MKTLGFFSLLLSLFMFSCKTQNVLEQPKDEAQFQHKKVDSAFLYDEHYEYQICKDDKVSMSIWDHDNMSIGSLFGIYNSNEVYGKWVMVDAQGNITVPKVGKFHIKDLTVIQAKDSLTKIFSKWIINPVIELKVLNKEITILGELKTPGKYVVERDMNSLLDIIARAGDFEMYANKKSIKIIRQKGNEVRMINVDLTASGNYFNRNLQVHPGDLIVVPSKKSKDFERRISAIIPIATSVTAATLLVTTLL